MPLFLSNFVQTIIMFFNIVGQGFTIEYCGRKMAQLSSTCFFVLQFYRILLLISVNGKNDKFVFNPRQGKQNCHKLSFSPRTHGKF